MRDSAKRGRSSNCEEGAYRHFEVGSLRNPRERRDDDDHIPVDLSA